MPFRSSRCSPTRSPPKTGRGTAIISASLRSGTNQVHGSAFEFIRNQVLDARNFFNTTGVRPPVKQNQFGFTLGGPVYLPKLYRGKDRTFIFGDYEGTRIRRAQTFTPAIPSAAMRRGDFSELRTALNDPATIRNDPNRAGQTIRDPFPGNIIPQNRAGQGVVVLSALLPAGQHRGRDVQFPPPAARHDRQIRYSSGSPRLRRRIHCQVLTLLTSRRHYSPGQFEANGAVTLHVRKQRAAWRRRTCSVRRHSNEFRLNYVRTRFFNEPQGLGTNHTVLSGIGASRNKARIFRGFPGLGFTGYLGFNANAFSPIKFRDNKYELDDSIMWARGAHTFKAGILLRRYDTAPRMRRAAAAISSSMAPIPVISFADFLLSVPFQGRRTFPRNSFGASSRGQRAFLLSG